MMSTTTKSPTDNTYKPFIPAPTHIHALLADLHAQSLAQETALSAPDGGYAQIKAAFAASREQGAALATDMMRDKFIALSAPKAAFMYHLLRSTGALNVVEAGTSFGVSTIYLALAVGANAEAKGVGEGRRAAKVIATEHEPAKAERAREFWREAGPEVERWVELREGDLRETLKADLPAEIDFLLLDIWTPMALPTLKLVEPRFRKGAVILVDNTISSRQGYSDYFDYINREGSGYRTLTLPYEDGLEMTIFEGRTT